MRDIGRPYLISLEGKIRWKSWSQRTLSSASGKLTDIMRFDLQTELNSWLAMKAFYKQTVWSTKWYSAYWERKGEVESHMIEKQHFMFINLCISMMWSFSLFYGCKPTSYFIHLKIMNDAQRVFSSGHFSDLATCHCCKSVLHIKDCSHNQCCIYNKRK